MKKDLHEMIHEVKLKYRTEETVNIKRNFLNESYQQYEFLNMKGAFDRLIKNM